MRVRARARRRARGADGPRRRTRSTSSSPRTCSRTSSPTSARRSRAGWAWPRRPTSPRDRARSASSSPSTARRPDIAGQGIANPAGAIWSAVLMLEHLGEPDAAARLLRALEDVCRDGPRTRDVGGTATTREVGDAVAAAVAAGLGSSVPRALVLGGTGQIGVAVARRLLAAGWDVDLTGRNEPRLAVEGARFISSDRTDANDVRAVIGERRRPARGQRLLHGRPGAARAAAARPGRIDRDALEQGGLRRRARATTRTPTSAPHFDGPIRETQPTMAPSDADYDYPRGLRREQGRRGAGLPRRAAAR